jgi:hypothetical protein
MKREVTKFHQRAQAQRIFSSRHSSYLSDGLQQWIVALGVLLRNLVASLTIIGLCAVAFGVVLGAFYSHVPVFTHFGKLASRAFSSQGKAFHYVPPPWGVTLGLGALVCILSVEYLVILIVPSVLGRRLRGLEAFSRATAFVGACFVLIGIIIPSAIWFSSWLIHWQGEGSKPGLPIGILGTVVAYGSLLVGILWRNKQGISAVPGDLKKGEKAVGAVLPNSMIQMIIIWLTLLVLVVVFVLLSGWVATSQLPHSMWVLAFIVPLASLIHPKPAERRQTISAGEHRVDDVVFRSRFV